MNRHSLSASQPKPKKTRIAANGQTHAPALSLHQTFNPFEGYVAFSIVIDDYLIFIPFLSRFVPTRGAFCDLPLCLSQCCGISTLLERAHRGKSFVNFAFLIFYAAKRASMLLLVLRAR